jgi:hypothetical protein
MQRIINGLEQVALFIRGGWTAKFDGSDWTVFNESNSNLMSDRIFSIISDGNNGFFIGGGKRC